MFIGIAINRHGMFNPDFTYINSLTINNLSA